MSYIVTRVHCLQVGYASVYLTVHYCIEAGEGNADRLKVEEPILATACRTEADFVG